MRLQSTVEDPTVERERNSVAGDRAGQAPVRPAAWSFRAVAAALLLVLSWVLWLVAPVIAFLPLSLARRSSLVGAALVAAEVAFWLGLLLMGPELAESWKKWFPSGWWPVVWRAGTRWKRNGARR